MNRKVLVPVLVIGLALVIAPFAISLPSKAAAGERMLSDFHPLMQPAAVQKSADYYNNVFTPLGKVVPAMTGPTVDRFDGYLQGFQGMQVDAKKIVPLFVQATGQTPAQVQQMMGTQLPAMSALLQSLPQMQQDFSGLLGMMKQYGPVFSQVPAGLAYYEPLVTTMQGNVGDYAKVDSLPNFNLFTWFFVTPGALLVLLSGWGLWADRGKGFAIHPKKTAAPVH